jgi:chromosome segregation ATPase
MSVDAIAEAVVRAARSVGKQVEDRIACQLAGLRDALERLQTAQADLASRHSRGIETLDQNVVNLEAAREELQRRAAAEARIEHEIDVLREALARLPGELPAYGEPLAALEGSIADCRRHFDEEFNKLIARLVDAERGEEIRGEIDAATDRLAEAIDEVDSRQSQSANDLTAAVVDLAGCRREFEERLAAAIERIGGAEQATADLEQRTSDRLDALAEGLTARQDHDLGHLRKGIDLVAGDIGDITRQIAGCRRDLEDDRVARRELLNACENELIAKIAAVAGDIESLRSLFVPRETFDEQTAGLAAGAEALKAKMAEALADAEHRVCAFVTERIEAESLRRSNAVAETFEHIGTIAASITARQEAFETALREQIGDVAATVASIELTPGPPGQLPAVIPWRERLHRSGEVVSHLGGIWQARRDNDEAPGPASNAWEALACGVAGAEVTEDGRLVLSMSDGAAREVGLVRGPPGEGYRDRGQYRLASEYAIGDVVTHNGSAWCALGTGPLAEPPGPDWRLMVQRGERGSRGPKGLAADPAVVAEHLLAVTTARFDAVLLPQLEEKVLARAQLVAEQTIAGEGWDRGLRWRGGWSGAEEYRIGDLVRSDSNLWIARAVNTASPPATHPDAWEAMFPGESR